MPTSETLLPVDVPLSSAGAPLPHVFADEGRLLLSAKEIASLSTR
ncbi:hypothetical protein [Mesorhizobium sp. 128a]